MRKRPAARLVVLDQNSSILLFHFVFDVGPLAGERFWATPGGALRIGESFSQAAKRELLEETGIVVPVGPQILQRTVRFQTLSGEEVEADERYFLVRVIDRNVDESGQEPAESEFIKAHRWWSPSELAATNEKVFPNDLIEVIAEHA